VAKLSISVPDNLWSESRRDHPDLSPSQLVQAALRAFSGGEAVQRPAYAQTAPKLADDAQQLIAERLRAEARRLYEAGYEQGLRLAERLPWRAVDRLADADWDLGKWIGDLGEYDDVAWDEVSALLGGDYRTYWPEPTTRLGVIDALRSLWLEVTGSSATAEQALDQVGATLEEIES
jgi:hypothetical protein